MSVKVKPVLQRRRRPAQLVDVQSRLSAIRTASYALEIHAADPIGAALDRYFSEFERQHEQMKPFDHVAYQ